MDAIRQGRRPFQAETPSRPNNASIGQLRPQLRDDRLREPVHRPYHPSPLSRSPVQASISSVSRTAASIASSSRSTVSTSTAPPSTSSRFSINQAFSALNDDDISFFDRLVTSLPLYAADFSQLKSAYTALLEGELDYRQRRASSSHGANSTDWDAHLWSILLSLVKVRGRSWRERWDSVRLAFGLDPNSGDETDQSAVTQNTSISATGSSTQQAHDSSSGSESEQDYRQQLRDKKGESRPNWPRSPDKSTRQDIHLPRSSSPLPIRRGETRSVPGYRLLQDELTQGGPWRSPQTELDDPISAIQARLSRMLETEDQFETSSAHDLPDDRNSASPEKGARLPTDARRRFDQLVQSSNLARTRMQQSHADMHEVEAQGRLGVPLEKAELWRARRLLQTCLAWWITLTRKQLERSQNAVAASERVLVQKTWERWRAESIRALQVVPIGEKTDRVRCMLTAFRHWKRRAHTAVERKEELKKGSMRTAYYTTTATVKRRLLKEAFAVWRNRHRVRLADGIRQQQLQSGAFALWQVRSSQYRQLRSLEKIVKIQQEHSILSRAWGRWAEKSDQAQDLHQLQHHRNRRIALEALQSWRERATLSSLSRAFLQRRLTLAGLDSWRLALEQRQLHRRQEALANRWRAKRLKSSALIAWRRQGHKLAAMQSQAISMEKELQKVKLRSIFHRWRLESRESLLDRVRTAGTAERAFNQWKHRYHALTTSLQQRESTIINRRHDKVRTACLRRWRQLAKQVRDREASAQARRDETICNDYFITWRNKQLEHRLLFQKSEAISDYLTLRSTLRQWSTRLREHRAEVKEAGHSRRLVHQIFEIWRSKAAKQQSLSTLLHQSLAKKNEALARTYLKQWVTKIIEVRSRELEVKEQRERRLVKAAFYAWIEACLRHDDLLALMNSYVDVKEEDRKRQMFLRWFTSAREHRARREKVDGFANSAQKKLLAASWSTWQDRLKEQSLQTREYEMLMRRQHLAMQGALSSWQSRTLLLPAIRMRNTSLKRVALRNWREHLPAAQKSNQAHQMLRTRLLQRSWQAWKDKWKAERQLRAAARFGAGSISLKRLQAMSAANRSGGSSSPSVHHSSSPFRTHANSSPSGGLATPARRVRTSMAVRTPDHVWVEEEVRPGRAGTRETSFSGRSASVPRHLETSFASQSKLFPPQVRDSASNRRHAESPSRDAAARKARIAATATAPVSTSLSEQSPFSLVLRSSSSTTSASANGTGSTRQPRAPPDGPTLSSAARRLAVDWQSQSDTESTFSQRVRRSAKYDRTTPTPGGMRTVGLRAPGSNDGFEKSDSVKSAPVQPVRANGSGKPRQSLAVAEDMISQLRSRARSQQRHNP